MLDPRFPTKTCAEWRPTRILTSGLPWLTHDRRKSSRAWFIRKAEEIDRTAWSGTSLGAFQIAKIASPMNSSIVPCSSIMMETMLSKYSLKSASTSTGWVASHMVVQPAMSEKKMLTFLSVTPSCATAPRLRKCRTTSRGVNFENERTAWFKLWKAVCKLRTSKTSEGMTSSIGVTLSNSNLAVCDMSCISCRIGTTSWLAMPSASEEKMIENPRRATTITVVRAIDRTASSIISERMS
mmetsp:Transcript_41437/g.104107  ORF Transcript_41437/g.104107 Transcript_41437/m.104107 type:complete len:239 (-) Transcript_41437:1428-2144(-)